MNSAIVQKVRTRRELEQAGLAPSTITRRHQIGLLTKVRPGVFADAEDWAGWNREERCWAQHVAAVKSVRGAVLSHESAALWHGAPLLTLPRHVHLSVPGCYSHARARIVLHSGRRAICARATSYHGLRITDPIQTVIDCARHLPVPEALCIADFMLSQGFCAVQELRDALERVTGRGCRTCRAVAEGMSPFAESPAATLARWTIHELGLAPPAEQKDVWCNGHRYRFDFLWEGARVILEVDGEQTYAGSRGEPNEGPRAEHRRQRDLEAAGWRVIRVRWRDLQGQSEILRAILERAGVPRCR